MQGNVARSIYLLAIVIGMSAWIGALVVATRWLLDA